jgi:predicted membrane protein
MSRPNSDSARAVIEQIWYRARINAFAHRAAAEEASSKATRYFKRELFAALGAILCIILVYLFSTSPEARKILVTVVPAEALSLTFTFLSIIFTLYSLYESVVAHYMKYEVLAARHEHLLNSFQFLAQRAREVKWPDLPPERVFALLDDLEREFALLKATGSEPKDAHFDIAHSIVKKIRDVKDTRIAQSFEVGNVEDIAQHVGDPSTPQ